MMHVTLPPCLVLQDVGTRGLPFFSTQCSSSEPHGVKTLITEEYVERRRKRGKGGKGAGKKGKEWSRFKICMKEKKGKVK